MLLDSGGGVIDTQVFKVGGDVIAQDGGQGQAARAGPGEEPHGVAVVGGPGVLVAAGVGEEGEEAFGRLVAAVGVGVVASDKTSNSSLPFYASMHPPLL